MLERLVDLEGADRVAQKVLDAYKLKLGQQHPLMRKCREALA